MRLILARHGATQHNLDGRLTGQIDAPLSALGERQAVALASRLENWRFDAIIASDLIRARATAAAIARRRGLPVDLDPDLREIDMGTWSGKPNTDWSEAERARFAAMERDAAGTVAAPEGESFSELAVRVERALLRARERFPDGNVLWVTHGGVISALLTRTLGIGFDNRHRLRRANCALFELIFAGNQSIIARLNDTAHLEALEAIEPGEARQAI
jgi:probable phosphoglycerate mutase